MQYTMIDNVGFCHNAAPVAVNKCITVRLPMPSGKLKVESGNIRFTTKLHSGVGIIPPNLLAPPGTYQLTADIEGRVYDLGTLKSSGGLVRPGSDGTAKVLAKVLATCREQEEKIKAMQSQIEELNKLVKDFKFF